MSSRLKIGGIEVNRKKKEKKKKKRKRKSSDEIQVEAADIEARDEVEGSDAPAEIIIKTGSGRITSSGTTVQGHERTRFMDEMRAGDAIIVRHPRTLMEETRLISMVVSNVALGISSAFSSDLISTAAFKFVKAPKTTNNEDGESLAKKLRGPAGEIFGRNGKSREELMDARCSKKSDRFCM